MSNSFPLFAFGMPGGMELFIIFLVVLILFGGKKIPEIMRGLGKGISEFNRAKNETIDAIMHETPAPAKVAETTDSEKNKSEEV
ncbi:MAG: Sec-independent protein translocase subunit TatA/TatB [Lentisphaeria bacterium]